MNFLKTSKPRFIDTIHLKVTVRLLTWTKQLHIQEGAHNAENAPANL